MDIITNELFLAYRSCWGLSLFKLFIVTPMIVVKRKVFVSFYSILAPDDWPRRGLSLLFKPFPHNVD
jgi:hypothetical protein